MTGRPPDGGPRDGARDAPSSAGGVDRHACVRAGVASVRIEGGDVDAETSELLDRWARGEMSEEALMAAILAPYAGRR